MMNGLILKRTGRAAASLLISIAATSLLSHAASAAGLGATVDGAKSVLTPDNRDFAANNRDMGFAPANRDFAANNRDMRFAPNNRDFSRNNREWALAPDNRDFALDHRGM